MGYNGVIGYGRAAGGPSFNPVDDPDLAGLWLALNASDNGTTLTVPDLGLGGYHLTATGTRPTIDATGVAGQRSINFSALAAGNTPLSVAFGGALGGHQQVTVFSLVASETTNLASYLALYGLNSTGDWDFRYNVGAHKAPSVRQFNPGGNCDLRTAALTAVTYSPKVLVGQTNAALIGNQAGPIWQSSKLCGSFYFTNAPNPATFGNKTLYAGSRSDGVTPYTGRWGGMAIVRRLLSQSEIEQWSTWLLQQYSCGPPKQVMWVGDSLTQAIGGYRLYVRDRYVEERGLSVAWGTYEPIGPQGLGATYPENYHDGINGTDIVDMTTRMATTLAAGSAHNPDVVALCNCGTNDVLDDASAAVIASRWETLMTTIYDLRPTTKIRLISLINTTNSPARTQTTIDANLLGPSAVAAAKVSRPGMNAEWVDGPYTIALADTIHPTTGIGGGYDVMGTALWPFVKSW